MPRREEPGGLQPSGSRELNTTQLLTHQHQPKCRFFFTSGIQWQIKHETLKFGLLLISDAPGITHLVVSVMNFGYVFFINLLEQEEIFFKKRVMVYRYIQLFSNEVKLLSDVQLFDTRVWQPTRLLLSMGFSKREYWSGLPSPGDLPNPGIEPRPHILQADVLTSEPPGKPRSLAITSMYLYFSPTVINGNKLI